MGVLQRIPTCSVPWLLLLIVSGCREPNRAAVGGKVTLDGQPVEEGTISFIPPSGHPGPTAWGPIKEGTYAISAHQGPAPTANRVEIHWTRRTGRKSPYFPEMDEYREAIPDRYHRDSQLQVEVKPGENRLDFELKSQ